MIFKANSDYHDGVDFNLNSATSQHKIFDNFYNALKKESFDGVYNLKVEVRKLKKIYMKSNREGK